MYQEKILYQEKVKMLEVNFGKNIEPTRFQLTDVGDDCFVLSKWDHVSLLSQLLNEWIQQNIIISEQEYQKMVNIRSGLIDDLEEAIDSFFFDSNAYFKQNVCSKLSQWEKSLNFSGVDLNRLDFTNNNRKADSGIFCSEVF